MINISNLESQSVVYYGENKDKNNKHSCIIISLNKAILKGVTFEEDGVIYVIKKEDKLKYMMARHCPWINVKMKYHHEYTISELYSMMPLMLEDIFKQNGGLDYLATIMIGYDELYNQEYNYNVEKENPSN